MGANVVSPVFIGRREELASLAGLLERAWSKEPAFALIGGEAGVGKTRITRELATLAADQGWCVLTGQCVELGGEGLPLAPLVDALRTLARTLPPGLLADVLGPAAPTLSRLLPELARVMQPLFPPAAPATLATSVPGGPMPAALTPPGGPMPAALTPPGPLAPGAPLMPSRPLAPGGPVPGGPVPGTPLMPSAPGASGGPAPVALTAAVPAAPLTPPGPGASGGPAPGGLMPSGPAALAGPGPGGLVSLAGEDVSKAQLLEHVLGTLGRLSGVWPVLLTVEDLHWADRSTLDLIAFLFRSLRLSRVMIMVTYRSDELHRRHPLRPLLTSWERDRSIARVDLARFSRDEVAAQLGAIFGQAPAPAVADTVFDRSGGNAYLVEELAGAVAAGGDPADLPPSLGDVLLSRVDALTADTQKLLRTASVAGRAVPDRLLAEVAGLGQAELYTALREAVDSHLLVIDPSGHGYAFRHALTRDAVYEDMLPGERVRLHGAYAAALDRDPALAGGEADAAALAYHWYAALDLPRALPASVDAAMRAMTAGAPAEALRLLERALEIWPRVPDAQERTGLDRIEVSRLAANAAYRYGALDRARSLLADALAEVPRADQGGQVRRALLLARYGMVQRDSSTPEEAVATLREALALLPPDQVTRAHAVVLATLASTQLRADDLPGAAETARLALGAARAVGAAEAEADAAVTLGCAITYLNAPQAGLESLRDGLRIALALPERARPPAQAVPGEHAAAAADADFGGSERSVIALRAYINLSDVLEMLGRHGEAVELAQAGAALAARDGMSRTLGSYLIGNTAEPLVRLGRWAEADELIAGALAALPEGVFSATLHGLRAELAAMRGRYDEAASELRETRRVIGDTRDVQFTLTLRCTAATIALGLGEVTAARQAVLDGLPEAGKDWGARYAWPLLWVGMRLEADDATRHRDRREPVPGALTARCAALARVAAGLRTPTASWSAYRELVAAERSRAEGAGTPATWAAAVSAWRGAEDPYPLSYCLLRLAETLTAAGDLDAAGDAVRQSYTLARRLGAEPVAAEARALARRARLSLPADSDVAPSGADAPGQAAAGAQETAAASAGGAAAVSPAVDELGRFGLTDREREVLVLLAAGRSNPEIAKTLYISAKTASVHVSNILAKLGVSGRVEAAAVAHRLGITG